MIVHHLDGYIQSIYLVEYPDKLMLLDGCCRADVELIERTIVQTLKRSLSDLKLVVVTHMHPDHAGAAHCLRARTGCRIASAKQQRQWYWGMDGVFMYLTDIGLARWMAKRKGRAPKRLFYRPWLQVDDELIDGDRLPGFEQWRIIQTPGHTDRDVSVMHEPSGRIYVADLMVNVKGRFVPPFPVFYPELYRHSVERVASLKPAFVWLAHGGEIEFNKAQQDYLLTQAPKDPVTHWGVIQLKVRQMFIRR
jgi:glyoxylase-like metal-dependent hydrolase (beta-lactamase superfamily II)